MRSNFALSQTVQNKLLSSLRGDELQRIQPYLTRVRLVSEQVLIEHRHPAEHVFFLEEGIVSLVCGASWADRGFQVAMVGREGLVGCETLLGGQAGSFTMAVVKMPGLAYRMNLLDLQELSQSSVGLQMACTTALEMLLYQVMQTAAFGASNTIEGRCARWLLMAHDRIDGNDIMVTHEGISSQLGVRRSGITIVVATLQESGLIRVGRGRITILDRAGLERIAGYEAWSVETSPAQLIPTRGAPFSSAAST